MARGYRKRHEPPLNQDEGLTDWTAAIADFRGEVAGAYRKGQLVKTARSAGLSPSTLSKLLSGETRRPHGETLSKLAKVFGYRLTFLPAHTPTVKGEIRLNRKR